VSGKGRDCPPDVIRLAAHVGAALATLAPEVVLICGGLDGVMDAAARGMTHRGGVAIGLIPEPARCPPSPHLTYAIRTGLPYHLRDVMLAATADLGVVLPGSHGTLIEGWAMADLGVPLLRVGDRHPMTGALPFDDSVAVSDLAATVARYLRL